MERAHLRNQGLTTDIFIFKIDLYFNVVAALPETFDVNYTKCFSCFLQRYPYQIPNKLQQKA